MSVAKVMYTGISAADRTRGLADERRVKQWLATRYEVVEATREEQIFQDIDCHITTDQRKISVSIKSQMAAVQYKNIGLELITEQDNKIAWDTKYLQTFYNIPGIREKFPSYDELTKNFRPAWFLFGKADEYLFLLGESLIKVSKSNLLSHCHTHGLDYTRWLAKERLAGQGGANAMSGYVYWTSLNTYKVTHTKLMLR